MKLFNVIQDCPQHIFIILTKRPERLDEFCNKYLKQLLWRGAKQHPAAKSMAGHNPLMFHDNAWLGVSVENQETANKRIPILLQIPAAVRFVSVEPCLSKVDLTNLNIDVEKYGSDNIDALVCDVEKDDDTSFKGAIINWIICGAETGPGARPMNPEWARKLRDDCEAAGVPFFMKQLSNKQPIPDDLMVREFPK